MENLTSSDDILVFCGKTMQKITKGYIPATTHRVVRQPHQERYSMPLEVKANDSCRLEMIRDSAIINEYVAKTTTDPSSVPKTNYWGMGVSSTYVLTLQRACMSQCNLRWMSTTYLWGPSQM